jgi:plastocyanin
MTESRAQLAWGSGREVVLADALPHPTVRERVLLDGEATSGALLREGLFLVLDGRRLVRVDPNHPAAPAQPMDHLLPETRGRLQLAGVGNLLLVSEDHHGVHVLKFPRMHGMPGHESHGSAGPVLLGRYPLTGQVEALTAAGGDLWLATGTEGELRRVDLRAPARPALGQVLHLDAPVRALSGDGTRLHALTDEGLHVLGAGEDDLWTTAANHPEVRGAALLGVGRTLLVSSGDDVQAYQGATPEATEFTVNVFDDFFTPEFLTVNVGDTVEWRNLAGIHNVFSCMVGESGCTADASETFQGSGDISGIPWPGPWVYSYTFTLPGVNPYVCQSHAPFMTGEITVVPGPSGPPPVPDGTFGAPMTIESTDPSVLTLHWDTSSCSPLEQHEILYGSGAQLPSTPGGTFDLLGSRCLLGAGGSYVWTDAPTPGAGELVWWLLVAYNDGSGEGSWGRGSDALERNSPFPGGVSGQCGNFTKDLANTCPQNPARTLTAA